MTAFLFIERSWMKWGTMSCYSIKIKIYPENWFELKELDQILLKFVSLESISIVKI